VLLLQDTTECTYQRARPGLVGMTKSINSGKDNTGRLRHQPRPNRRRRAPGPIGPTFPLPLDCRE
jgi:hypothetical protein